ncbi:anthranilate phosphoribosyltransferase [Candidatus Blochmannia ocreatus (nom. nud.)]|uniref:Anthranilate phosphoribosyltransferase n=1 Tax=Candidatus Blochmannia ocreatus (nom. nud.) TaxID=251538 RepID=A0ABY4SSR3_9ENTR|nr:anthranilate phosphoribosyltransferase [Candidatus Blochmannia ocreatus]URJ24926.1 anthranilate phosphoribosyltransferase [Candidatus Blochmannia ocreatus]
MQNILEVLYHGHHLNQEQIETLLHNIINKQLSSIQITAALISMKVLGETYEEIAGAVKILSRYSKNFPRPNALFADITGTGGDKKNTINISTISAIVASTCGVKIIKHGNNHISSNVGSVDILKKHNLYATHSVNESCKIFEKLGICFLHAPQYYEVFNDIMSIRQELKTPTLFNIIGPLLNPSKPPITLIGVYKKKLISPIIQVLKLFKYHRAIVVHCDGIDEVGLHAPTHVAELNNNNIYNYIITASDFGLNYYPLEDICCASKYQAYEHMTNILKGKGNPAHSAVIAANVSLLLKLFGNDNLRSNAQLALQKMQSGIPYTQLLSLSR